MSDQTALLSRVESADEVEIETRRGTGEARRTIIWIVADGGRIYVRSVRGPGGKWYRRLRATPEGVLHVAGTRTPFRAVPVSDAAEIERVSAALRRKYAGHGSSLTNMLRPETLPTTLRLEPASSPRRPRVVPASSPGAAPDRLALRSPVPGRATARKGAQGVPRWSGTSRSRCRSIRPTSRT
jgi:hypothetical protein